MQSFTVAAVKNLELALIPATIEGLKVTAFLDSGIRRISVRISHNVSVNQKH